MRAAKGRRRLRAFSFRSRKTASNNIDYIAVGPGHAHSLFIVFANHVPGLRGTSESSFWRYFGEKTYPMGFAVLGAFARGTWFYRDARRPGQAATRDPSRRT